MNKGALTAARLLTPMTLLAGCSFRPWTPSVGVAYWGEEAEDHTISIPPYESVVARWQLPAASPWAPYQKMTLLSSIEHLASASVETIPDVESLEVVQRAHLAGDHVGKAGVPSDAMWILDLRGAASVAFATSLSKASQTPIAPVMTFNNWPGEDELIPAEETLAALITETPRLPDPNDASARPVLMLDAWRLAYRYDDPGDDTYDNRYALNPGDLPDIAALRAQGITNVIYVVEDLDDADLEEDDLHAMFLAYQEAGIRIAMVDLASLESAAQVQDTLPAHLLRIETRATLLDDPEFYARAHGGFGGIHIYAGTGVGYGTHWGHWHSYGGGGWGGFGGG